MTEIRGGGTGDRSRVGPGHSGALPIYQSNYNKPNLNANYITALVGFSPTSDLEIDYRRWKDTLDNKMVWSFYCSDGFLILSALYFPQRRCVGPPVVIIKQLNNTPDNGRGGTLEMLSPSSVLGTLQMHFHLTD